MRFRVGSLIGVLCMLLTIMVQPVMAYGVETACTPFDLTGKVCDQSIPRYVLGDTALPDDDLFYRLDTQDVDWESIQWDEHWETTVNNNYNMWFPTKIGATFTLPKAGSWMGPDGTLYTVDARFTVTDWNGLAVLKRNVGGKWQIWLNLINEKDEKKFPEFLLQPIDHTKRLGGTIRIDFVNHETGRLMPDMFSGYTGFNDLDGNTAGMDGETAARPNHEGWELLDGFAGMWWPKDHDLAVFGQNGVMGDVENSNDKYDPVSLARHRFAATFHGNHISLRYSALIGGWSPIGSDEIAIAQTYPVTWRAETLDGTLIKDGALPQNVSYNGTWNLTPPSMPGYTLIGLKPGSDPASGTITRVNMRGQNIVWQYAQHATLLPATGGWPYYLTAGVIVLTIAIILPVGIIICRHRQHSRNHSKGVD